VDAQDARRHSALARPRRRDGADRAAGAGARVSRLEVVLDAGCDARVPGESVSGQATWELDAPPRELEVRLFWYTEGRGDQDQEGVASEAGPSPGASGRVRFR